MTVEKTGDNIIVSRCSLISVSLVWPLAVTPFACHQISSNVNERVTITDNPHTPKLSQKHRTLLSHKWEKPEDSLDES
jgi:hypothetical protein